MGEVRIARPAAVSASSERRRAVVECCDEPFRTAQFEDLADIGGRGAHDAEGDALARHALLHVECESDAYAVEIFHCGEIEEQAPRIERHRVEDGRLDLIPVGDVDLAADIDDRHRFDVFEFDGRKRAHGRDARGVRATGIASAPRARRPGPLIALNPASQLPSMRVPRDRSRVRRANKTVPSYLSAAQTGTNWTLVAPARIAYRGAVKSLGAQRRTAMIAIGAVLSIAAFGAILTDPRELPVAVVLVAPLGAAIVWSWRTTAVVAGLAYIGGAMLSVVGDAYEGAALWLRLLFLAVASMAVVALAAAREQRERAEAERRDILRRSGAQERAIERLTSLQTVVASTAKEATTTDVAGVITSEARKVLDADRALLYRLERGHLELVAYHGYRDQSLEPFRVLDLDRVMPATDVVRTGRDLIIESREAFRSRYSSVPAPLGELEASALAVPMRAPHELVGVLYLAWFRDHEVGEPEIDLAHALADAGALALRRAVLHDNLRMSEHRYRGLVEATAAIVWRFDAERRVLERQPEWEAYTGQEWPTYRDYGWIDAIQPEDQERFGAEWNAAVATGEPIEIDFRLWHAESGEYRFVTARGGPTLDDGVVLEWSGTIIDVHDRTEAILQSLSEARLRSAVVSAIQDGLFVCLPSGQMIDANIAFTRLVGFTREEILEAEAPHPWWPDPELHGAERGRVDALYGELRDVILGDSGGGEFEVSLRHKDGYLFPTLISVAAIRGDDGRVAQVVGTVKDITERKAVEDALRSERDYREAIVAALQEGLVVVATDGAILDVNETWTTMTGFGRGDVVGTRPPYPWWNAERARDPFTGGTPLLTGTTAEYEATISTATGNLRRVVINRHPLHDPATGEQLGYVATFRDITRRVAVEARLRVLAALTSRLASANGLEEVGAAGLAEILPALETEYGAMFALDTDHDSVHLIAASGLQSQIDWREFPLDFPAPVSDAARSREITMTENRDVYALRWPALAERLRRGPLHATLEVPLVKGDAVVGVLFVGWDHNRALSADERELLDASGSTMAQALDRARLFEFQRSVASTLQHAMLTAQPVASPSSRSRRGTCRQSPNSQWAATGTTSCRSTNGASQSQSATSSGAASTRPRSWASCAARSARSRARPTPRSKPSRASIASRTASRGPRRRRCCTASSIRLRARCATRRPGIHRRSSSTPTGTRGSSTTAAAGRSPSPTPTGRRPEAVADR